MNPVAPHPTAPVVKNLALSDLTVKAAEQTTDGANVAKFSGVASAVGVLDRHSEVIEAGAFDATLASSGPTFVLLYQHDPAQPIGVIHLSIDARGDLRAEGEINLDVPLGKSTHALMMQGALKSMSIGFNIPDGGAVFDQKAGVLRILAVDLWEVSVVTFPANPAAIVDSVKTAFGLGPDDLKAGRVLSKANRSKLEEAVAAMQAVLDADQPPAGAGDTDAAKSLQAPSIIAAELDGVKALAATIRRELSDEEPSA